MIKGNVIIAATARPTIIITSTAPPTARNLLLEPTGPPETFSSGYRSTLLQCKSKHKMSALGLSF